MNEETENIDLAENEEELFEHHRFVADPGQTALRLDKFVLDRLGQITRNRIQNYITDGFIKVNDKEIKANYKVRPKDVVTVSLVNPPRNEEILPENIPLDIVYEDEEMLIVNKVAGMVVHPAYSNWSGTLVNALVYHFDQLPTSRNGAIRPGLVHRIDKNTSGLLVIAKTEEAMSFLARQFFDHTIERTYYALVWGIPKESEGTITGNVGRSQKDRKAMTVYPDGDYGKHAVTHYKVLETYQHVSLIQCNLETGRTHQIRAHMKFLGHPLFNDDMYGGDKVIQGEQFTKYKQFVQNTFKVIPRQALHAKTLGLIHPKTKEFMQFESELPSDLQQGIDRWKKFAEGV